MSTPTQSDADETFGIPTLLGLLSDLKSSVAAVNQAAKAVEKSVNKKIKQLKREVTQASAKSKSTPKRPSGFAKPTEVSAHLAEFMGRPTGDKIARTEATQWIIQYIAANGLQDENDRRNIIPDQKLVELFSLEPSRQITYFEIQGLLNPHFSGFSVAESPPFPAPAEGPTV